MPFHQESLWGATLMPHRWRAMDWDKTIIVRVGKNSGPVSSFKFQGSKFMKFWNNVGDPSYFLTPLPDCLCHVSFSRYSPLSLEVVEKPNKCKSFLAPNFFGERRPQIFYDRLLARRTVHRLAKCGLVPFADISLLSLAMKWNADFTEGG